MDLPKKKMYVGIIIYIFFVKYILNPVKLVILQAKK
jgi:hypothetical protein